MCRPSTLTSIPQLTLHRMQIVFCQSSLMANLLGWSIHLANYIVQQENEPCICVRQPWRRGEGVEPSGNNISRQAGFEDRWGHRAPSSSKLGNVRVFSNLT